MIVESKTGDLQLLDARSKRNNGWFVVRSLVPAGATQGAIEWIITPHAIPGWKYQPVIHVSQVGYHPAQKKLAIIELDRDDAATDPVRILRIDPDGGLKEVFSAPAVRWGEFVRYQYAELDFSRSFNPHVPVAYRGALSQPFRIAADVYQHGVWQPVLEYFLPVQIARYARGAAVSRLAWCLPPGRRANVQGELQPLRRLCPGSFHADQVPARRDGSGDGSRRMARCGDFDLRIESQADEVSILASAYENFHLDYDDTTIDEQQRRAQIHVPDGQADALQQVEHGILTILGGYRAWAAFTAACRRRRSNSTSCSAIRPMPRIISSTIPAHAERAHRN